MTNPDTTDDRTDKTTKGAIFASCGHKIYDISSGVDIRIREWDCDAISGFRRSVTYAHYCQPCADMLGANGDLIETDEQEDDWLSGQGTDDEQA